MNLFIIIAFVLGGGTIAADHLTHKLSHWLAVALYIAAVILLVTGMIVRSKAGN